MEALDAPVSIEMRVCVTGGALGSIPWILSEIETVDGVQYVRLSKLETGFSRFVFGGYRQRDNSLTDSGWLDILRGYRNKAQTPPARDNPMFAGMKSRRTPRRRPAARSVELELPPIADHDGVRCRALTSSNPRSSVSVELKANVLSYVRAAIIEHGKSGSPIKRERPVVQGERRLCRWTYVPRKDGESQWGFQALRTSGSRKTRFFPCASDSPEMVEACREQALLWAKEGDNLNDSTSAAQCDEMDNAEADSATPAMDIETDNEVATADDASADDVAPEPAAVASPAAPASPAALAGPSAPAAAAGPPTSATPRPGQSILAQLFARAA